MLGKKNHPEEYCYFIMMKKAILKFIATSRERDRNKLIKHYPIKEYLMKYISSLLYTCVCSSNSKGKIWLVSMATSHSNIQPKY